ncbi:MAG: carboxylesterase [Euryarchaeota archaeon]|nr:carboxylesterase [Euryarchaeota archaeon]|tara:strand:- start:2476 stop:3174 length:699 start_codon:yes stop_codon:yes gene_type:complete
MADALSFVEVGSDSESCDAVVIWLHGLGADGHDFAPVARMLSSPGRRYILPHAPSMPVTINGGMWMPAWYDILSMDPGARDAPRESADDVIHSTKLVNKLIENEINNGIPEERIVIAGFSQGGALALYLSLRSEYNLAGVVALSCYLPVRERFESELKNTNIPIFQAHGRFDMVVPYYSGLYTHELLTSKSIEINWHEYQIGHEVSPQEISDIGNWLNEIIPPLFNDNTDTI